MSSATPLPMAGWEAWTQSLDFINHQDLWTDDPFYMNRWRMNRRLMRMRVLLLLLRKRH